MRFAAVALACASTVLGYTITSPNPSVGWTNQGGQLVEWTRVASDRENITIVLTNPDRTLMPNDQVLAALVVGSLGNATVNPPSAGWPAPGTGYVVNFVAEVTNLNQILAQSQPFEIEEDPNPPTSTRTNNGAQPTGAPGTQDRDKPPEDTTNNGALSNFGVPAALVALAGAVSASLL